MDYVLKNANIFNGSGFYTGNITICDGIVFMNDMRVDMQMLLDPGARNIDCTGKYVFPGLADVHVHLREPGFSYKETIKTGSLAAARGGFTDLCAMPNVDPVPDTGGSVKKQLDIIKSDAAVHVYPYGAITMGRKGEYLSDMEAIADKVCAFSDDGSGVQEAEIMFAAMLKAHRLKKLICAHCEDNSLLDGGYIHAGKYAEEHGHKGIGSDSEWKQLERDLAIASETDCAYHVCHVSTKESVELIRHAKAGGVNVTCETAPHYIAFCDEDIIEDGRFKMNPPLRSKEDRDALIAGIKDGTIDMIATDHAPHSAEEKSRGLKDSLNGVVGLETSFAACYTYLVRPGHITLERLIELMSEAPKKRFGIGSPLTDGLPANLTVFDLDKEYTVDPAEFLSMGKSTPFEGKKLFGRCLMTFCEGGLVWEDKE